MLPAAFCKKYTRLNPINSLFENTAFNTSANIELVMKVFTIGKSLLSN